MSKLNGNANANKEGTADGTTPNLQAAGATGEGNQAVQGAQSQAVAGAAAAPAGAAGEQTGAPKTYEVKVGGVTRLVTAEELVKGYEKAGGADETFRKASDLRKQNAEAIQMYDLVQKTKDESATIQDRMQATQQLAVMFGQSPEEAAQAVEEIAKQNAGMDTGAGQAEEPPAFDTSRLPPAIQDDLRFAHEQRLAQTRNKIWDSVENSVDKDGVLGKLGAEDRIVLKELAKEKVKSRVVADGEEFGPDMVVAVLQELRPVGARFGKPQTSSMSAQDAAIAGLSPEQRAAVANALGGGGYSLGGATAAAGLQADVSGPQRGQGQGPQNAGATAGGTDRVTDPNDPQWGDDLQRDIQSRMQQIEAREQLASRLTRPATQ